MWHHVISPTFENQTVTSVRANTIILQLKFSVGKENSSFVTNVFYCIMTFNQDKWRVLHIFDMTLLLLTVILKNVTLVCPIYNGENNL